MKNPFEYGSVVSGEPFCNRRAELADVVRAMENSEKLFLLSERKYGKQLCVAPLRPNPDALLAKDVVDRDNGSFVVSDRFFRLWIQGAQIV